MLQNRPQKCIEKRNKYFSNRNENNSAVFYILFKTKFNENDIKQAML